MTVINIADRNKYMNIDYLYWFFSTIAQTLGAIVAVGGMLAVYRLQMLYNRIRDIMKDYEQLLQKALSLPISGIPRDLDNFIKACRRVNKYGVDIGADKIEEADSQRNKIIQQFKPFLLIHLEIIFASIIALPLCKLLALLPPPLIICIAIFAIGFTTWALVKAFQQTKELCIILLIE